MAYRTNGSSMHAMAQGLGWFSIGLGLSEILAPRTLARSLGMDGQAGVIGAYGVREILTGIAILSRDDPTPWLWGRVAGDALDLATLAPALSERNPERGNAAIAVAAVVGATMLDVACAVGLSSQRRQVPAPVPDYGDRSGLPRPPEAMRGAARDFVVPRDMRIPEPLRPYAGTGGSNPPP
jgi:hypothetical protein